MANTEWEGSNATIRFSPFAIRALFAIRCSPFAPPIDPVSGSPITYRSKSHPARSEHVRPQLHHRRPRKEDLPARPRGAGLRRYTAAGNGADLRALLDLCRACLG